MTTTYGGSVYPTGYDAFLPQLVDNVDEVMADHPNTALEAVTNLEAKLGIDGDPILGLGGVCFEATGKAANPGALSIPTVWVDNNTAAMLLKYTDALGVDWELQAASLYGGLDYQYDFGGTGAGRTITADGGAVEITVPDTSNNAGLTINQNDTTNDPAAVVISNSGTGAALSLTGAGSRLINSDAGNLTVSTTTSGTLAITSAAVLDLNSAACTLDATTLSIDSTDDTNLSLIGSSASNKTLTISASNTSTGVANIDVDADGAIYVKAVGALGFTGAATTLDCTTLSIDATDSANLTVTANSLANKTLVISAYNTGTGVSDIDVDADGAIVLDAVGFISIDAGAASNFSTNSANLTISTITSGTLALTSAALVDLNAVTLDIDATGDVTLDGIGLSIDSTDTTNLSMITSSASTKTLTISASNTSTGVANIDVDADGSILMRAVGTFGVTGAVVTLDAGTLSIDSTDTTNLSMTANSASDKTLTIAVSNSNATGVANLDLSADGQIRTLTQLGLWDGSPDACGASFRYDPNTGIYAIAEDSGINADAHLIAGYYMNPSGTTITDVSTGGHNGTTHGSPVAGREWVGHTLSFDGATQYLDLTGITSTAGSYTFEFWVNATSSINSYTHIWNCETPIWQIRWYDSGNVVLNAPGGYYTTFGATPLDGLWHHFVITCDASTSKCKCFKDGVQFGSEGTYLTDNIGGTSWMFARGFDPGYRFNGKCSSFALYDEVKDLTWIQAQYAAKLAQPRYLTIGQGGTPIATFAPTTTIDCTALSIDSTDTTNFSMSANSLADKTLTIAATNSHTTGVANVAISADGFISVTAGGVLDIDGVGSSRLDITNGNLTIATNSSGSIYLVAASYLTFEDGYKAGSSYSTDLVLSDNSAEWSLYETNFGEVSILNAISQAYNASAAWSGTADMTLAAGDVIAVDNTNGSGRYGKANADSTAVGTTKFAVGVVSVGGATGATIYAQSSGKVTVKSNGSESWPNGSKIYLSTVAGYGTVVGPTGSGDVLQLLGVAEGNTGTTHSIILVLGDAVEV